MALPARSLRTAARSASCAGHPISMAKLLFLVSGLSLLGSGCGGRTAVPQESNRELVVARAQPSVLQVISSFDFTLTRLLQIRLRSGIDGKALVTTEFAAAKASGKTGVGATLAAFGWQRIATNPERYLQMAGTPTSFVVTDQPCSTGTAFSVDGAGTLLTNLHVISPDLLKDNQDVWLPCTAEDIDRLVAAIAKQLDGEPAAEVIEPLEQMLVPWLHKQYQCTSIKLSKVRVATHLMPRVLPTLSSKRVLTVKPPPKPQASWKNSTVVCEVLAQGELFPGKDVAVLRAKDLATRLINLPLGDSSRVMAGTKVYALGFPVAAVIDGVDPNAARFRVIAHDGIVDQRLPMLKGWEAFHMTANINHGDSGGPVVDEQGLVIAFTVAGNPNAPAQNLAIPIDIAKLFLAQARILTVESRVTQTWRQACEEFQARRFTKAMPLFEEVNRLQSGFPFGGGQDSGQAAAMIQHCRDEIQSGRDETSWWSQATGEWGPAIWKFIRDLPWYQQVVLGVFALSALGGLLKLLRSILSRRGSAVPRT